MFGAYISQGMRNITRVYQNDGRYSPLIWNCYSNENDLPLPQCRISGAHELMSFKLGDNYTEFEEKLEKYTQDPKYQSNTMLDNVEGKLMNVAEISGPNFIIHTTAGGCLSGIRHAK